MPEEESPATRAGREAADRFDLDALLREVPLSRAQERVLPPMSPKAWQRVIRETHGEDDPRPPLRGVDGCVVEAITRQEAAPFILKYEWLGTMGRSTAIYGMRAPDGELIGVSCFGWPGAIQSRDICGPMIPDESDPRGKRQKSVRRDLAICLERGACSHHAPPNGASFLISRSVALAARDGGWRIFYAYADPEAGEIGTVYQACNWLYIGQGVGRKGKKPERQDWLIPREGNKIISSRTLRNRHITITQARYMGWKPIYKYPKHKYVHFEGTPTERRALRGDLRYPPQPYPKR